MDVLDKLDFVRLAALANEHAQDARLWRWFANMLEDGTWRGCAIANRGKSISTVPA